MDILGELFSKQVNTIIERKFHTPTDLSESDFVNRHIMPLKQLLVENDIKERLERFCEEVSSKLPSCPFITDEIIVKIGAPVDKILDQVEKSDCDLVVMGAHGHGIIGDAMMGSVSRRVVRHCKKPVLVIRLPEEEKD